MHVGRNMLRQMAMELGVCSCCKLRGLNAFTHFDVTTATFYRPQRCVFRSLTTLSRWGCAPRSRISLHLTSSPSKTTFLLRHGFVESQTLSPALGACCSLFLTWKAQQQRANYLNRRRRSGGCLVKKFTNSKICQSTFRALCRLRKVKHSQRVEAFSRSRYVRR